ncbi:hypothetical protein ACIQVL_03220 [Streptomyces sp. NPDC090499]|uniref:hypothetical protein n=1 Tax=Streptomyces sp. NPDC090499 TaxID=3365965 RepID=UPI00381500B9
MPRFPRSLAHRPRPAAILASSVAVIVLGTLGAIGASDATPDDFRPHTDRADIVTAYNAGWKAGVADLGDGTRPTIPHVTGDANDAGTVAWVDGWIDGQADALGEHRDASHTSR